MKLIDALPRLGMRFPHIMAEQDPAKQRVLVHSAIIDARDDIAVLQVLAHSLRTTAHWQRQQELQRSTGRATLMSTPLEQMTDAQLRRRASIGGNATVRAEINKEVIRRAQIAAAQEIQTHDIPAQGEQPQPADALKSALTGLFGKEPNPPLAVDDEADDRL